ncbi:MAG: saccharopine dehydrogenase [Bacteroidetes bacterium]|nr:MAG: saccharopine dehydrogenase [Bacteroidota bacterium]REK05214.1 MAG: saccharopine dehydrogenase [Bacteroidota bacterium]REK32619.1 MAG: saccharopine dehydrogenase [Bacteroidota bacterium]REK48934.1 MAG: saccharopine dehydrogenase [Bacteroidota bacterium]
MKKIYVLGTGRVGRAIAIDLCREYNVSVADYLDENLDRLSSHPIKKIKSDLREADSIERLIVDADLVIGAVPGFMGFETAKRVISCKKNMVDISFFNEDMFELNDLAIRNNVTAVMDCGVAPGMDNIILGYHNKRMKVNSFECLVGGLPVRREWPYEYKAPFSPIDVIAEYTRPARIMREGSVVTLPALSEAEIIVFPEIGKLEAFNTDGLRSLLHTMKIPNMTERTLRYPGHIDIMKILRETGYFREDEIEVKGKNLRPIDLTAELLFPMWKLEDGEEEFTVMRVTIKGEEKGKSKKYVYDLLDRYDKASQTSSMARTTGYTCTAAARLVLNNTYTKKGISPPEYLGESEECFRFLMEQMKIKNIKYSIESF